MKLKLVGAIGATLAALAYGMPSSAQASTLVGDTFNFAGFGNVTTNGPALDVAGIFDISVTDNKITFTSTSTGTPLNTGSSNPFDIEAQLNLLSGTGLFQSVTVDPATNITVASNSGLTAFSASDLFFSPTQLTLGINGSYWTTGSNLTLDVNGSVSAVPEASTWSMMLAGFAALGFVAYHRSRKAMTLATTY